MDDGGLATELNVFNVECSGAGLCSSEELKVQGEGIGLVLAL